MMRRLCYFILPFALSALSGCSSETTESDNVKTQAIWSNIYRLKITVPPGRWPTEIVEFD